MKPKEIEQALAKALGHHQTGAHDEAAKGYAQVRAADPKNYSAWYLAGALAFQRGDHLAEAVTLLGRARQLQPGSLECRLFLGMALADIGRHADSLPHLEAALTRFTEKPEAWDNLAKVQQALGRPDKAAAALQKLSVLCPNDAVVFHRLGLAVGLAHGLAAALPHFQTATRLDPFFADAWASTALAHFDSREGLADGLAAVFRATTADSSSLPALRAQAIGQMRTYQPAAAYATYERMLGVDPLNLVASSGCCMLSHYLPNQTPQAVFALHKQAVVNSTLPDTLVPVRAKAKGKTGAKKIRLGFVSPDLHAHSVAFFLEPLLRHLDREQFEIQLFATDSGRDAVTDRLRAHADQWVALHGISDDAAVDAVRAAGPDVLVDLAGHSNQNSLALFARRLAPVQINYLGYPHSTGLYAMDCRFVDAQTDPVDSADALATERLVRFAPTAWSYQPPAEAPAPARTARAEGEGVVFASFSNFLKVTNETLALWAEILRAVPGARLQLKSPHLDDLVVARFVRPRLTAAGIDSARVTLSGWNPAIADHLAAYNQVDIALDSFPYHGTTTTCEALWMGVPVVTLAGATHASRVGVSLLNAVGHSDWVAQDRADYVRIASELARDPAALDQARAGLREAMEASALLDHAGQARRFGEAVLACVQPVAVTI
ncbi:MAG: tetratricopeptide repeat protein [Opitutus sp.]|nr:tetratricopeptide repeat protein [Opitutus sp.]MCS6245981.1 tetratricopeptide repeat protein [Opitutus sp.]MCS6274219.1 tetratricopeptide repeat protein [Opitutus sp.]MCS6277120.1 tetratricopeptide repeat protein [Opitutus sp.]MCS6300242.1 tetratricopeptide repeat protein [Opitutus sp.]